MTVRRAHPTTVVGRAVPAAADPAAARAPSAARRATGTVARLAAIVAVPVEPRTAVPVTADRAAVLRVVVPRVRVVRPAAVVRPTEIGPLPASAGDTRAGRPPVEVTGLRTAARAAPNAPTVRPLAPGKAARRTAERLAVSVPPTPVAPTVHRSATAPAGTAPERQTVRTAIGPAPESPRPARGVRVSARRTVTAEARRQALVRRATARRTATGPARTVPPMATVRRRATVHGPIARPTATVRAATVLRRRGSRHTVLAHGVIVRRPEVGLRTVTGTTAPRRRVGQRTATATTARRRRVGLRTATATTARRRPVGLRTATVPRQTVRARAAVPATTGDRRATARRSGPPGRATAVPTETVRTSTAARPTVVPPATAHAPLGPTGTGRRATAPGPIGRLTVIGPIGRALIGRPTVTGAADRRVIVPSARRTVTATIGRATTGPRTVTGARATARAPSDPPTVTAATGPRGTGRVLTARRTATGRPESGRAPTARRRAGRRRATGLVPSARPLGAATDRRRATVGLRPEIEGARRTVRQPLRACVEHRARATAVTTTRG